MPLTLTTHDTRFDDPDPATIAKVLGSLDGDHRVLATLERSEATYVQAEGSAVGGFALEYQDGTIDRHYRSRGAPLPLERASRLFEAYARGDATWHQDVDWELVPYEPPHIPWFSTWWGYVLVLAVVAGAIWWWRG